MLLFWIHVNYFAYWSHDLGAYVHNILPSIVLHTPPRLQISIFEEIINNSICNIIGRIVMYLCSCVQVIFAEKCNMVVVTLTVLTVKACSHCKRTEKQYRSNPLTGNLTWLRTNLMVKIKEVFHLFSFP